MIKLAFQRFLGPVAANLLAVVAFVVAVGTGWRWVTLALVAATLAVNVMYREGVALGRYLVSRALVAGGVLAAFIRFLPDEVDWAFNASAALTLGYISMETVLNKVSSLPMDSRHLRVPHRPASWLINQTSVFYADCALIALFAVAPLIELQSWTVLICVIAVGVLHGLLVLESIYTKTHRRAGRDDITAGLTRYKPDFLIHWDAAPASMRQVLMWLPYLERVGARFAIVVRRRNCVDPMAAVTNRPVVLATSLQDIDAAAVPSLKAVFYVNNGMRNAHLSASQRSRISNCCTATARSRPAPTRSPPCSIRSGSPARRASTGTRRTAWTSRPRSSASWGGLRSRRSRSYARRSTR
ncbi:hypothetical protein ACFQX7_22385 [Luedemannella flava]